MRIEQSSNYTAAVTVMRQGDKFGASTDQLEDGNTIPRLCQMAGEGACANVCQLYTISDDVYQPKMCAEENISIAVEEFGIHIDSLVIAAATQDNVVFGDSIHDIAEAPDDGDYQKVPAANAFFFRPYEDKTLAGQPMLAAAMRMADCGSLMIEFEDKSGALVLGQSHFSRTNMRGPTAYKSDHELDGKPVSWAEYVFGQAIEHYGAKVDTIKVKLAAAVEGKDFVHHYNSVNDMNNHFPGWAELGFIHPDPDKTEDFDCLIDYRQMIEWQMERAAERFGLEPSNIDTKEAINTGDISTGHASHHWASEPKKKIAHGRDMYIIGVTDLDLQIHGLEASMTSLFDSAEGYFASAQFEDGEDCRNRAYELQAEVKTLREKKLGTSA